MSTTTPKTLNKTKSFCPMDGAPTAAFVRVNPGVPAAETKQSSRFVLYEPVLTFSPVLASRRLQDNNNTTSRRRALITDDQVHDLVESLDAMMMMTKTDSKQETKGDDKVVKQDEDETKTTDQGRFEQTVMSPSKGSVTVKRSHRLSSLHS